MVVDTIVHNLNAVARHEGRWHVLEKLLQKQAGIDRRLEVVAKGNQKSGPKSGTQKRQGDGARGGQEEKVQVPVTRHNEILCAVAGPEAAKSHQRLIQPIGKNLGSVGLRVVRVDPTLANFDGRSITTECSRVEI